MNQYLQAAKKLHEYIVAKHWTNQALIGPDPGVRFNYRIGRFIKSYLHRMAWNDDYCYLQAQGYWILANWSLFAQTDDDKCREIALLCSEFVLTQQRDDGAWDYPNPEWKGRVATVEGIWAAIGLLETYRHTANPIFLSGALRWYAFLVDKIGFQRMGDELAVNYFASRGNARVPNNSTMLLYFLAELTKATDDMDYLEPVDGLLAFLHRVQMPTGELPYAVGGLGRPTYYRPHLQCYQYNAFECLDLIRYYEITEDKKASSIIGRLLNFLREGLADDGHAYYDCSKPRRRVFYHAAAMGAAFFEASQSGIEGFDEPAKRAFAYVIGSQRVDGGFVHSQRDYGMVTDRRSYPRYLSMILHHLLLPASQTAPVPLRDSLASTSHVLTPASRTGGEL